MRLFSFLLFYKAFSFLTALVLSCSPEISDWNFFSISLSGSNSRFNVDLVKYNIIPGTNIISFPYDIGNQPAFNEIFLLKQPITGAYEFRPFADFYRTLTIEIPINNINIAGSNFILNPSNNEDNQRFSIECNVCNPNINSTNWIKYHTSCSIKNLASKFCVSGGEFRSNLTQVDCANAPKWDFLGILSPDAPSTLLSPTITPTSTGRVSTNILAVAVTGSILGTALIAFVTGYLFIKYHKQSKQFIQNDLVNNQVISHY